VFMYQFSKMMRTEQRYIYKNKEQIMNKKDYVALVMDEWYESMATNNVSVQPKASTLLGTILAKYDVQPKQESRNLWDEFLTVTGGQFKGWYDSLSEAEKEEFHKQRQKNACNRNMPIDTKSLLKG
jgi:hypothetical protein